MTTKRITRAEYVERVTRWLMPDRQDPELAQEARAKHGLTGVYTGKSQRIHRMVKLAYLRGARHGAGCAWEAQQPVVLRDGSKKVIDGQEFDLEKGFSMGSQVKESSQ